MKKTKLNFLHDIEWPWGLNSENDMITVFQHPCCFEQLRVKKMGLDNLKFYCDNDSKEMSDTCSNKKTSTEILYFPLIRLIKLVSFLDESFFCKYVANTENECPNIYSKRIWSTFLKNPAIFLGLFTDGLKVFKSGKFDVWPVIGYFLHKDDNSIKQDTNPSDFFCQFSFPTNRKKTTKNWSLFFSPGGWVGVFVQWWSGNIWKKDQGFLVFLLFFPDFHKNFHYSFPFLFE